MAPNKVPREAMIGVDLDASPRFASNPNISLLSDTCHRCTGEAQEQNLLVRKKQSTRDVGSCLYERDSRLARAGTSKDEQVADRGQERLPLVTQLQLRHTRFL